ncbi:MAG: transposase [Gemmatimonadetes bacterium]|nr:transposase [Gemmatimonadota bacterium]
MNVPKCARLTPAGRALPVRRVVDEGLSAREVALAMGVSPGPAYKWVSRFKYEGEAGRQDRSSKPLHSPRRLGRCRRRQIEKLRRKRYTSPRIARELKLPISTVVVTLRRLGLERLSRLEPPRIVIRHERSRPGELLHMDTKKLGRIARIGHRIHGDQTTRVRGIGWEYLHVCVDDATRIAYTEVLTDEKGESCAGFLLRAVAWYRRLGIEPERVMTDNGSGYVSQAFRGALIRLRARHLRTRPHTPRTNGGCGRGEAMAA